MPKMRNDGQKSREGQRGRHIYVNIKENTGYQVELQQRKSRRGEQCSPPIAVFPLIVCNDPVNLSICCVKKISEDAFTGNQMIKT